MIRLPVCVLIFHLSWTIRLANSCRSAGFGGGPAFCFVFEEHGFDEFADDGLFVGVEVLGGFEGEFEVVVGLSFVGS